jgi:hypothetical protein
MASHRFPTGDGVEISESNQGMTSGSDANSSSEKRDVDFGEKTGPIVQEDLKENGFQTYSDVEAGEEVIHHPANKDDILTHTIHVEDDPTQNALTFRTWFLGMFWLPYNWLAASSFTSRAHQSIIATTRSHPIQNLDQNLHNLY